VTGMGPAQEWKPSSYRAENYGLLSILRFLGCLFKFCGSEPRCSKIYCDNLGLITKILSRAKNAQRGTPMRLSRPNGTSFKALLVPYNYFRSHRWLSTLKATRMITSHMTSYRWKLSLTSMQTQRLPNIKHYMVHTAP
jgi:hypothetical protein